MATEALTTRDSSWAPTYVLFTALALVATVLANPDVFMVLKTIPIFVLLLEVRRPAFPAASPHLRSWATLAVLFALVAGAVIVFDFKLGTQLWLGTHLSWMIALSAGSSREQIGRQIATFLPSVLAAALMVWLMLPRVEPDLQRTVIIYTFVHPALFGLTAIRAQVTRRHASSRLMMAGSGLFVLSDTLLALNRWVFPTEFAWLDHKSLIVQGTYLIGVWLMVQGIRKED